MNGCADILTQIVFYLDDELEEGERVSLEAHLADCRDCRSLFELERSFVDTIRRIRPLYAAPPDLRASAQRILSEAPAAPIAPVRLRRRVSRSLRASSNWASRTLHARGIAAIASLLIIGSAIGIWGRYGYRGDGAAPSDFARTAVDAHIRHLRGQLPLEIASAAGEEVSRWFAGKVPFKMELPTSQELSGGQRPYTLEGARLVGFKDDYVAYVSYKMAAHPVSLLVTSTSLAQPSGGDEVISKGIAFHYNAIGGLNVITWADRGLTYALVSDLDKRGRESCVVCHQGPKEQANADLGDLSWPAAR